MVNCRICLITPGHLSTNPRLVKEADALAAAGYAVQTIAADYLRWARTADEEFVLRPWSVVEKVRFGPLGPRSLWLKQGLRLRLARQAVRAGFTNDALLTAAWHPAACELAAAAAKVEADLYIAHYPAALPAAAAAARLHGARYAFDAEDFHPGDPPEGPAHELTRRLTRAIEGRYLPGAAYVTAASPDIADAYAREYAIATPKTILNVFPLGDAPAAASAAGTAAPGPSVYWFSQTIGPDRGLECALQAIARSRSRPHFYVRGQFAAGYRERLTGLAKSLGCADRLHVLAPEAPSQMVRLAAQYDVGLASEIGHTPNRKIALTNKLFTYLLAGLPVMISDTPAQARFAAEAPSCLRLYPCDEPQSLARELDMLLLDPAALAAARAAAFELGRTRYNWETESLKLIELVGEALSRDGRNTVEAVCASP